MKPVLGKNEKAIEEEKQYFADKLSKMSDEEKQ